MRYETAQHVCFSIIYELHIVCTSTEYNIERLSDDFTFNQLIIWYALEIVCRMPSHLPLINFSIF